MKFGNAIKKIRNRRALLRLFQTQELYTRKCPLCLFPRYSELLHVDRDFLGIVTSQCLNCGLIYSNPFYSESFINEFYEALYREKFKGEGDPVRFLQKQDNLNKRAKYFSSIFLEFMDINIANFLYLDVGCGEGSLLKEVLLKSNRIKGFGIEPEKNFRNYVSSVLGVKVEKNFDDFGSNEKFNLISLIHVLEHVIDPLYFLDKVRSLMHPDGFLFVDVPNVENYESIEDIHAAHSLHFSPHTLRLIIEKAGLEILCLVPHKPPTLPFSLYLFAKVKRSPQREIEIKKDPMMEANANIIQSLNTSMGFYFIKKIASKLFKSLKI